MQVFTPSNEGLLVDLADSLDVVTTLLESLPEMFAGTQNTQSALGPALQGAYMVTRWAKAAPAAAPPQLRAVRSRPQLRLKETT